MAAAGPLALRRGPDYRRTNESPRMKIARTLALLSPLVGCIDNGLNKYDSPPTAEIVAPIAGDAVVVGLPVALSGVVSDEQNDPTDIAVTWAASADPQPVPNATTSDGATTATWTPRDPGTVDLTLTATADDVSVDDTVTVSVLPNLAPQVVWVSPVSGSVFLTGDWPEVVAQATDDEAPADLTLEWTANGAPLPECTSPAASSGEVRCTPDALPEGDSTLCLDATDSIGQTGSACAVISIVTCLETSWYTDADGDGFGDPDTETVACDQPAGTVADDTDCDDDPAGDGATTYPGADEYCDGVDNDCDGDVDEDGEVVDGTVWYADSDGDSYGDPTNPLAACTQPVGYTVDVTDCDDADGAVHPGAVEVCDGVDDDCDGTVDLGAADAGTWYADTDGDGFGDPASTVSSCTAPTGYVADATDCDDSARLVNPAATEVCDGLDNNCDGLTDDASSTDASVWFADADGDTYGDPAVTRSACTQPANFVGDSDDCDDTRSAVNPAATELCNGLDDDCDGATDEDDAADASTFYADVDRDAFGDPASPTDACAAPVGFVADDTDCDDGVYAVNPAATEYCDGIDNDCDGLTDEGSPPDGATWYADADHDTYGDPLDTRIACSEPTNYVATDADCDDTDPAVNPAATEACNGIDDDCDTLVDESGATGESTWYADTDGDAFGDDSRSISACSPGVGYVADNTDCVDTNVDIYPGAVELCDGLDNDCDGFVDEGSTPDGTTWYADLDADGYGDPTNTVSTCSEPDGYVCDGGDCDDGDPEINPGEPERLCNTIDDNCDGTVGTHDYDVPGDYSSISSAVASVPAGSAICVAAGTYRDSVYITKRLTLEGADEATTIIDARSLDRGVDLRGFTGTATVRGFTIEHGTSQSGGGLHIYNVDGITIEDVRVADSSYNSASTAVADESQGSGIKVYGSTATLRNVDSIHNTCTGYNCYGAGLDVLNGSTVVLENVRLIANSGNMSNGTYGAAMYIDAGSTVTATNLIVAGNTATASDGGAAAMAGIYDYGGSLTITNAAIVGNTSAAGTGGGRGAGVRGTGATASITLVNVTNTGNSVSGATVVGAGYALTSSAVATFSYCNTWGNSASDYTGVVDPTGTGGNLSVDPAFVNDTAADPLDWDLTLDSSSPLIDAGSPSIVDPDCSVGDIGAYGGSEGAW